MSLPEILVPAGTPAFALDGLAVSPRTVYADVPMGTGHTRRRRSATIAPRIVNVGMVLDTDQMTTFDAWFESTLRVGSLPFTAELPNQGEGFLFWSATWLSPYLADPISNELWTVTGQLLLTGEGSATPPVSTSLALEFGAALTGTASLTVTSLLELEFGAELLQPVYLSLEFGAALRQVGNFRLREDSSYTLREGGGRRIRESA